MWSCLGVWRDRKVQRMQCGIIHPQSYIVNPNRHCQLSIIHYQLNPVGGTTKFWVTWSRL